MNEEVESLRKRLQDLHEKRLTGFVNDEQFAQSRALLERKLVDAVMRSPSEDEEWPATVLMGDMRAEPVPMPSFAAPRPLPDPGRLRWLVAIGATALAIAGATYWWAVSSRSPAALAAPAPQAAGEAVPAEGAGAVVETVAGAADRAARPAAAPSGTHISGTVALSPALAARVQPHDTLFIFARAVDGPPMPLAVIRKQAKDLPYSFTLDDSMAAWPEARVSAFSNVVVTARLSRSGEGQPRNGDLEGRSPPISAGVNGVRIEIAEVVQQ